MGINSIIWELEQSRDLFWSSYAYAFATFWIWWVSSWQLISGLRLKPWGIWFKLIFMLDIGSWLTCKPDLTMKCPIGSNILTLGCGSIKAFAASPKVHPPPLLISYLKSSSRHLESCRIRYYTYAWNFPFCFFFVNRGMPLLPKGARGHYWARPFCRGK